MLGAPLENVLRAARPLVPEQVRGFPLVQKSAKMNTEIFDGPRVSEHRIGLDSVATGVVMGEISGKPGAGRTEFREPGSEPGARNVSSG